jgi:hypothetical protein
LQRGPPSHIPVIEVAAGDEPGVVTALAEPARLALLIAAGRRSYTPLGLWFGDRRSRAWAARSTSPYAAAVVAVDRAIGRPGAFLLNYSYEWGCTTAAAAQPGSGGTVLLRTLDWPFDGLGRALVVARRQGAAGPYLSATWPGYVGVLTALAAGRFAAAINQPPLPLPRWGKAVGWLAARVQVNRSAALPPSHLLRLACETCRDFAEAAALLRETPICLPAIFTLAGRETGQALVIERTQRAAFVPDLPVAANHWTGRSAPAGRPRDRSSTARHARMTQLAAQSPTWSLDWLRPPLLQGDTRVAVMADPRSGRLLVQGWEATGPATTVLDIS